MSAEHLKSIDVDPESAELAIDLLEAYAELCLSEIDEVPSDDVADDWVWTVRADAATALREAGQWALMLDPMRARDLLFRAGEHFLRIGQPFGAYLMVVAGGALPPAAEFGQVLADMRRLELEPTASPTSPHAATLQHPQQQAYLLLAAIGSPDVPESYPTIDAMMSESPHGIGVVPVGALGTPIRRYWRVADGLLASQQEGPDMVARQVAAIAQRYAEAVELAQTNHYTWHHAAAPIDVGDIDVVGIVQLAARQFGFKTAESGLLRHFETSSELARLQLEIALEFAREDPRRTTAR